MMSTARSTTPRRVGCAGRPAFGAVVAARRPIATATLALVVTLLGTVPAAAQDLEYTTTTTFNVSRALGPMLQMLGGANTLSARAYVKGTRLRIDLGTGTTILDAAKQEMVVLDRDRKTYATTPFGGARAADSVPKPPSMTITTERTRDVRRVNGVAARRTDIVARVPARNPAAARAQDIVVLAETWTATAPDLAAAYERVTRSAEEFGGVSAMLIALFSQDPRAGAALRETARATLELRGLPVRRRTVYGTIATGRRFSAGVPLDTLMAVTTDITDLRRVQLAPSLFEVPRDYSRAQRKR